MVAHLIPDSRGSDSDGAVSEMDWELQKVTRSSRVWFMRFWDWWGFFGCVIFVGGEGVG